MLEEYKKKRDFNLTPEPPARQALDKGELRFVIQKHAARRLHYDFRLEIDGVLVSWAVPKGPSLNPADKRLSVQTEDHPLDYAHFEGVIPAGEYGGGPVIIWDEGVYSPDFDGKTSWSDRNTAMKRMREGLKKGKISFFLKGRKLHGSFTLFRLSNKEKDWILLKHKDEFVDRNRDVTKEDRSVVSGKTIEEMRKGLPAAEPLLRLQDIRGTKKARMPATYEPMLASLADGPFSEENWIYEPKMDGIRVIAMLRGGEVTLLSRRGIDITGSYPEIVNELEVYQDDMILDGEIVALDENGRPSFQLLQQRSGLTNAKDVRNAQEKNPAFYYVFDIVYHDGSNLENVKLSERKVILKQTLAASERVRLVDTFTTDGITAFKASVGLGLEGIVAKKLDSLYTRGGRSKSWLKVKATDNVDLVICGYTEGTGSRAPTFGSLILGYYDESGHLVYAGGCGTGFNDKILQDLAKRFKPLKTKTNPFAKKIPGKLIHFLEPKLVAEIKFAEWTNDGILRSPVFLHLRDDKRPKDCTRLKAIHQIVEQGAEPVADHPKKSHRAKAKATAKSNSTNIEVIDLASRRYSKSREEDRNIAVDEAVLDQLNTKHNKMILEVAGQEINLTNLDKVFWPAHGDSPAITKRDYMMYLTKVAPGLLPHMKHRPLTFVRFPMGIGGGKFYQKHWEKGLPDFVETIRLFVEHVQTDQEYICVNNLPTLLWLAQIADLELHTWQSRTVPGPDAMELSADFSDSLAELESSLLNYPDYLLFDLDPYLYSGKEKHGDEPELHHQGFKATVKLAKWLKEIFDALSIEAFIKTTGKTGIHIYIPIVRDFTFDEVRAISEIVGRRVLAEHPNEITMEWAVVRRTGKVFLDHNMNSRGKTLASIYSPRVSPQASVSMPLRWDELDDVYPTDFTIHNVPHLLNDRGDLWADILDHKNDLRAIFEKSSAELGKKAGKRRKSS